MSLLVAFGLKPQLHSLHCSRGALNHISAALPRRFLRLILSARFEHFLEQNSLRRLVKSEEHWRHTLLSPALAAPSASSPQSEQTIGWRLPVWAGGNKKGGSKPPSRSIIDELAFIDARPATPGANRGCENASPGSMKSRVVVRRAQSSWLRGIAEMTIYFSA